jgi:hypothetical protein
MAGFGGYGGYGYGGMYNPYGGGGMQQTFEQERIGYGPQGYVVVILFDESMSILF